MTSESDLAPVLELERELKVISIEIMKTRPAECLHCYVYRMLEFGCRGLHWAVRYRDMRAPRATALHRRLMSKGAGLRLRNLHERLDPPVRTPGTRPRLRPEADSGQWTVVILRL
jgi:hypothetical protein